jgi:nucleoid DNA-binding protein
MSKMMTKSELIQKITDQHSDLTKKDVKAVMETLATVAYKELKKTGAFLLPGFAKRSRAANSCAFSPAVRRRRGN